MSKRDEWKEMKDLYDRIREKTKEDLRTFEKAPLVKPYYHVTTIKPNPKKRTG